MPHVLRARVERRGLERGEAAEREERYERDALLGARIDERVVLTVRDVVQVLDAHDGRHRLRLGEVPLGHVAEPEVADLALLLQLDEHSERLRERWRHRDRVVTVQAQVDHVEPLHADVAQVVLDGSAA